MTIEDESANQDKESFVRIEENDDSSSQIEEHEKSVNKTESGGVEKINIDDVPEWNDDPVSFGDQVTFEVAKLVLLIFVGVYAGCFILALTSLCQEGSTAELILDFSKFMLTSIVPLVTLAVGYYLGDRNSN